MPKVSIIMNCLNGERYLRKAIDSIYAQSYKDWEIIFFDNASADNSASIAKSYSGKLRYFFSEQTLPLGEARNRAMEYADGEFIGFLDCDDIWVKRKIEKQLPLFEKNSNTGLVFGDAMLFFQSDGTCANFFEYNGMKPQRGNIFGHLLNSYFIPMPTVMLRKSALTSMDEWFDSSYEHATDYDLFLRLASRWECDYVDEAMAVYRIHQSATSSRTFKRMPFEIFSTMNKLKDANPNMMDLYKREGMNNSQWIDFLRAKALWREGNGNKARRLLMQNALTFKAILLFFLSFLKYEWTAKCLERVQSLKRNKITEEEIDVFVQNI